MQLTSLRSAQSAPFAMGKFALRGLAQSMARELHPQGIHVAHVVVDGIIRSGAHTGGGNDNTLDPDAIAESYLHLIDQPRNCWSWEIEVRPWVETFLGFGVKGVNSRVKACRLQANQIASL